MVSTAAVVLWGVGGATFLLATLRSRRHWGEPGARPFTALIGILAVASLALAATAVEPVLTLVGTPLVYHVVPVVWAIFAFEYTGRFDVGRRRRVLLLLPGLYLVASHVGFWTATSRITGTPAAEVKIGSTYAVVEAASGPLEAVASVLFLAQYAGTFYLMGLMVAATVVLVAQSASHDHVDTRLSLTLVVVGTAAWFVLMTGDAIVNMTLVDPSITDVPSALTFAVSGLLAVSALERDDLFALAPAAGTVGPEQVLEDLTDAVVVADTDGQVIRLNPRARRTFAPDGDRGVGRGIDDFLGHDLAELEAAESLALDGADGKRSYEPTVSELTNNNGGTVGYAVVLRDVTDREMRQQRLEVLNRVLRHNLRNDMTTIRGRAEMLTADHGDVAEIESAITDTADDLVRLGERAREIEQMLSVPVRPGQRCSLRTAVDGVVRGVCAGTDATTEVTIPENLAAGVDERILRPVVRNLVHNAVHHNDRDRPTVRVTAHETAGPLPVVLVVEDDGPGLPDNERAAIQRGHEGPLQHSSGLGLWAVKWGVTRMGGQLSIEQREPRGTRVEIGLPGAGETSEPLAEAVTEAEDAETTAD